MRVNSKKRGKKAAKRLDLTSLRAALEDGRQWVALGTVIDPGRGGDHWEVATESGARVDVLIEVELAPMKEQITASLSNSIAGGGIWRVPEIGDQVMVVIPGGELGFMPTVVGILSNQDIPSRIGTGRTILVASDSIEIDAPKVYLGNNPGTIVELTDGLVHGSGIDPFTGQTYAALQSTTGKVFAKK